MACSVCWNRLLAAQAQAFRRLNAEIRKAIADPEVSGKLSALVLDRIVTTPDFATHLKSEYDRMKEEVKLARARIE